MANTFKNAITGSIGTTGVTVYTVPSSTVSTIIGVNVANVSANNIGVTVNLTDTSAAKTVSLIKNVLISPSSSIVVAGGEQKIVLEASDYLHVTSSVAASADIIISLLEMT